MKYLKDFKIFENFEQEVHSICKKYRIINYTINSNGSIDIDGDVYLDYKNLEILPLKFGKVSGFFHCSNNELTTLEGCPKYVEGNFRCEYNQLTTLVGCPEYVGGSFNCYDNKLTTLEGSPKHVGLNFTCDNNRLTGLEGCPQHVGGKFSCRYNQLINLENTPNYIGGNFYCNSNPIFEIWELFMDTSKIELFNDYDIIREVDGEPALVLVRLNVFLEEIGKPTVKKVDGWINI